MPIKLRGSTQNMIKRTELRDIAKARIKDAEDYLFLLGH
jgi:hypothetical protein